MNGKARSKAIFQPSGRKRQTTGAVVLPHRNPPVRRVESDRLLECGFLREPGVRSLPMRKVLIPGRVVSALLPSVSARRRRPAKRILKDCNNQRGNLRSRYCARCDESPR